MTATASSHSAVAEFRSRRRDYRFRCYDVLHDADRWHPGRQRLADALLRGKWEWKGRPAVALEPPFDWDRVCADSRSQSLALHSWEPLAVCLAAYDRLGANRFLDLALGLALDWLDRFSAFDASASPFAWYDMAVGVRAYRLAYLLDAVARDPAREADVVAHLMSGLQLHAANLAEDERFAGHSNHGLYQIAGQLAMARRFPDLPEIDAGGDQGRDRLAMLLDTHFTAEGVHREHSPQYHQMMLIPLRALEKAELAGDADIDAICRRIEDALAWFVTPAHRLAMFGDTDRRKLSRSLCHRYASPHLVFAAAEGTAGEPPSTSTKGFPESGYVVFRDRWPSGKHDFADCSYLAQTCAFHSRVHKHADDLSFVWHDHGCEILTDSGRFGYAGRTATDSELRAEGFWYSDPARVHVESTCAHNTVEVDGTNIPRVGVRPYGSALEQWGERGDVRFSLARIRYAEISHTRMLLFRPRAWLIVLDELCDGGGGKHDYVQRFQLAPELDLTDLGQSTDGAVSVELPSAATLHAVALLPQTELKPVRGETEPRLLGWISPHDGAMEPRWTIGWSATGARSHAFGSLFHFSEMPPSVDRDGNTLDLESGEGCLRWNVDGKQHLVALAGIGSESFDVVHSVTP